MRKRIFNIVFCIILLSMTFQSVPVKANINFQETSTDSALLSQADLKTSEFIQIEFPSAYYPDQLDTFDDDDYLETMHLKMERFQQEHLIDLAIDYSAKPYQEAKERKYVLPTAEVIAETQAQVRSFDCSKVTDVPQIECEALVAFYESTYGSGWDDNTGWLSSTTVSDWYGIDIYDGYVDEIYLNNNNLYGNIPSELDNLINLKLLIIPYNQIYGPIPSELGNLNKLVILALPFNQLNGNIPLELGNLNNLESLVLNDNQINGIIPPELGNLASTDSIYLDNNQIIGTIPPELGNIGSLEILDLSHNQLTGKIPSKLGDLSNLFGLGVESNQLTGPIPLSFLGLTEIDYFHFYDTDICEPNSTEFIAWKASVENLIGTDRICTFEDYDFHQWLSLIYK